MNADALLSRLDGLKPTGRDRWVARCPAHGDKSPSLSIREVDDRVLIHCFAGCGALAVLEAVGLDWSAVLPPRDPTTHRTRKAPPLPPADALRVIENEAVLVLIAAGKIERGITLTDDDMRRLSLACERITKALRATAWR